MILSTHGACLTQSSAAPSPIKMALLRMRGRQPRRVTVSCGHLEGGQCRGLDQDLRTPQHICSQNSLCLPPGFPSQPGASLAPPPALLTGPQYTLSPFVAFHPAPVLPQRIPSGPCLLPTFCRTTLSCPHTGVCHKVLVREELKISPGSRENPGPDQASKALPSGLGGKGGGLGEELGSVSRGRWDDTGQGWVCEDREQPWEDPGQRECEDGPNCCPHGLWHLARLCSTGAGQRSLLSAFSGPECLC